jgi:hypothetical protein
LLPVREALVNVLVLNCGSSSVKWQLLDLEASTKVLGGSIEVAKDETGYAGSVARILYVTGCSMYPYQPPKPSLLPHTSFGVSHTWLLPIQLSSTI